MLQLSRNFTLDELVKSGLADRYSIDNSPSPQETSNLELLVLLVLQPVRDHVAKPVTVRSGFRCDRVNTLAGSSDRSQHRSGEAADIEVMGLDNYELACWIRDNLDYDQLILEFYTGEANSGWVHVSYKSVGNNRKECLTINKGTIRRGLRRGIHRDLIG